MNGDDVAVEETVSHDVLVSDSDAGGVLLASDLAVGVLVRVLDRVVRFVSLSGASTISTSPSSLLVVVVTFSSISDVTNSSLLTFMRLERRTGFFCFMVVVVIVRRDADGMRSFTINLDFADANVEFGLLLVPLDLVVRFVSDGWALLACGESEEQTSPIRTLTLDDMSAALPGVAVSSLVALMRLVDLGVVVPLGRLRAFSTPAVADMRGACVRPRRFRRASIAA